jgi:thymidylate synthase ThyX
MMLPHAGMPADGQDTLAEVKRKLIINPDEFPSGTLTPPVWRSYTDVPYTATEKIVLEHFFTSLDRNIYGVVPGTMPDELWAFLIGRYSRSSQTLRDRFLAVFEEMDHERNKGQPSGEITLEELAQQISVGNIVNLRQCLNKARDFLGRWGVGGYGHASLRDSDILRLAVEGVSELATKFLEAAVLGAYQEQSTRYLNFTTRPCVIPPALQQCSSAKEITAFFSRVMQRYEGACTQLTSFVEERVLNKEEFSSPQEYKRQLRGKALDSARYFLPLAAQTSLGITMSAREMERHLSWLISQPLEELQLVGYSMLRESLKLSPVLLKHVDVNPYEQRRMERMRALAGEMGMRGTVRVVSGREDDAVMLLSPVNNPEDILAASFLYECSQTRLSDIVSVVQGNAELKEKIFSAYLNDRGVYDAMGKAAELGLLIFDLVLDNGAARDLLRHRKGTILRQHFTPQHGFEWPPYIDDPSLTSVRESYVRSVDESFGLWQRVVNEEPQAAQYLSLMGHKMQFLYACDPRQFDYVAELRTREGGHHSYVTLVRDMFRAVENAMPLFARYVRVHM